MDMSTETTTTMAGFFIYRSGEQSDPTSSLEFCPAKDSDELFFALKVAYPLVKTHSERMRNAVIEFLIKERDEEQTRNLMPAPALPLESSFEAPIESPWSSWPSMDSTTSTLSSPDMLNLATPASMSPSGRAPTMSRQSSQAQASTSRPGLEDMTGVFSLSSSSHPKTRVRRKMTESEKAEYRKRRIVKACDACSKRKRKCTHNQTEMEKVRSSKVTKNKMSATVSTISTVGRVGQIEKALIQQAEPPNIPEDPFMFLDQSLFTDVTEDYSSLLDDKDFEDFLAPKAAPQHDPVTSTVWPWSDTPDFTLLDMPLQSNVSAASPVYGQSLFPAPTGLLSPEESPLFGFDHEPNPQPQMPEYVMAGQPTPTRTWRSFSDFSRTAFSTAEGLDGKEMPLSHNTDITATTGDTSSPAHTRNLHSSSAPLTGTQTSLVSDSASTQFVTSSENSQAVQLPTSRTRGVIATSHEQASPLHGEGGLQVVQPSATASGVTDGHQQVSVIHGLQDSRNDIAPRAVAQESWGGVDEQPELLKNDHVGSRTERSEGIDGRGSKTVLVKSSRSSQGVLLPATPQHVPGTGSSVIAGSDGQSPRSSTRLRLTDSPSLSSPVAADRTALERTASGSNAGLDRLRSLVRFDKSEDASQQHRSRSQQPPSTPVKTEVRHMVSRSNSVVGYPNSMQDAVVVFMLYLSVTWRSMAAALAQTMCLRAVMDCSRARASDIELATLSGPRLVGLI